MTPGGFADYLGEARVQPPTPVPGPGGTSALPGDTPPLDRHEAAFLESLSPATRERTLRRIAEARHRDPRKVPQAELDGYDDETKWEWLTEVCKAEAGDKEAAAALAAQDTMREGHHE